MPANLVFRRTIWGARDNGISPRSTPAMYFGRFARGEGIKNIRGRDGVSGMEEQKLN